jgi:hypothetical protein
MSSALSAVPHPPEAQEVAILLAVAALLAVLGVVLYLTQWGGKDDRGG